MQSFALLMIAFSAFAAAKGGMTFPNYTATSTFTTITTTSTPSYETPPVETPSTTLQFNLVRSGESNEESRQFGFPLGDLVTLNAGQQSALKGAVASVQGSGDAECYIYDGSLDFLVKVVGYEKKVLKDGRGVTVGAVECPLI